MIHRPRWRDSLTIYTWLAISWEIVANSSASTPFTMEETGDYGRSHNGRSQIVEYRPVETEVILLFMLGC